METIFISIASYRDSELLPTLRNCLANAKNPKQLRFGICWQYDDTESLAEFTTDSRFKFIKVPYEKSKGTCWARNLIQDLYDGETYYLQLDSHHRFSEDWDVTLIKMLKSLKKKGHKKPLLTSYLPGFFPKTDPVGRVNEVWSLEFDRYLPEGPIFIKPHTIKDWNKLKSPIPSRFLSGHFIFTLGQWAKEVRYDPHFYFHGEEPSLAARSFTHGYDLFHPHKIVCWHEYTRKGRTKQWDDDKDWVSKNNVSHSKNRKLFSMDGEVSDIDFGVYGFGTERTLKEYEIYSGLRFSRRAVQQYTLDKHYPPNPTIYETDEEWEASFATIFKHCIDVGYDSVPEDDYEFWVVAFHDENDETIHRQDADIHEINRMKNDPDGYCKVWREFQTTHKPKYWVVWPFSKSKGWCDRLTGTL